jgi:apolipoprotein D and lipocalin family protein
MFGRQLKDLELQILDSEARLRVQGDRVAMSKAQLKDRVFHPSARTWLVAGAVVGGGAAAWWWARSRRPRHAGHPEHDWREDDERRRWGGRREPRAMAGLRMLEAYGPLLLPMLAPLLNQKVAATLHRLGVPIPIKQLDPLPTVTRFELARFAGTWHELARLPEHKKDRGARDVTLDIALAEDDAAAPGRALLHRRWVRDDGTVAEAQGQLRTPDPHLPGELELSTAPKPLRAWPGAWNDFWVLQVDDDYRLALVGTPDREQLWLLSREASAPATDIEAMKALAQRHGFDTTRLEVVLHTDDEKPADARAAHGGHASPAGTTLH